MNDLPSFRPFDPRGRTRTFFRYFPHQRQDGCTYFATFRLADSVPRETVALWAEEDRIWLEARGIGGPLKNRRWREAYEKVPALERRRYERNRVRRLHRELDSGHGQILLERWDARTLLEKCMHRFDGQHFRSGDYVLLPNRVHWILTPLPGFELEDILHTVKDDCATEFSRRFTFTGKSWQRENYDRIIRSRRELAVLRGYMAGMEQRLRLYPGQVTFRRAAWLDDKAG